MGQQFYSIKDLEILSGIKAHTIRIWEKRYGIVNPKRTDTNIRLYCDDDLKRLLNISVLYNHGLKISQIANLSDDLINEQVCALFSNSMDQSIKIEALILSMLDFNEDSFLKVLNDAILKLGFEDAMIQLIYPFFERVGLMWQTDKVMPAHEHFISHIVQQKIHVAIDALMSNVDHERKKFLLFLPEGEMHEIQLLFMNYLVRKYGHEVNYLGQNVPLKDLETLSHYKSFDYVVSTLTTSLSLKDLKMKIDSMAGIFSSSQVLLSGFQVLSNVVDFPKNTRSFSNLDEFKTFLEKL